MPSASLHFKDPTQQPCAHVNYVRMICNVIAQSGGDLDEVLSAAGTSRYEVDTAQGFVSVALTRSVIAAVRQVAGRPTLPLELGANPQMALHGALGMALSSSANVRQAMTVLARFLPTRTKNVAIEASAQADGLWLEFKQAHLLGDLSPFALDHFMAQITAIVGAVAGRWPHDAVLDIPWSAPPWRDAYAKLVGTVRFQTGRSALWLPDALLDRPCPTASDALFELAWRQCELEEKKVATCASFVRRVAALLRSGDPSLFHFDEVAKRLVVPRRTLLRRLQEEGYSFRALVEQERQQAAIWQLRHTDRSIADIAQALGYRDTANFSRTFRRWFAATPGAMRRGATPWPPFPDQG